MKSALGLRLSLLALIEVFVAREALATDATLSADTSISTAHPTVNFGGLSNLYVGNGNTTLIHFDLSSLPAGNHGSANESCLAQPLCESNKHRGGDQCAACDLGLE
jgi:hypothetical protein